jgi:secreted trypsin-like serine protease
MCNSLRRLLGGPLFIEGDSVGEDEQVGVVSWGVGVSFSMLRCAYDIY